MTSNYAHTKGMLFFILLLIRHLPLSQTLPFQQERCFLYSDGTPGFYVLGNVPMPCANDTCGDGGKAELWCDKCCKRNASTTVTSTTVASTTVISTTVASTTLGTMAHPGSSPSVVDQAMPYIIFCGSLLVILVVILFLGIWWSAKTRRARSVSNEKSKQGNRIDESACLHISQPSSTTALNQIDFGETDTLVRPVQPEMYAHSERNQQSNGNGENVILHVSQPSGDTAHDQTGFGDAETLVRAVQPEIYISVEDTNVVVNMDGHVVFHKKGPSSFGG